MLSLSDRSFDFASPQIHKKILDDKDLDDQELEEQVFTPKRFEHRRNWLRIAEEEAITLQEFERLEGTVDQQVLDDQSLQEQAETLEQQVELVEPDNHPITIHQLLDDSVI